MKRQAKKAKTTVTTSKIVIAIVSEKDIHIGKPTNNTDRSQAINPPNAAVNAPILT